MTEKYLRSITYSEKKYQLKKHVKQSKNQIVNTLTV